MTDEELSGSTNSGQNGPRKTTARAHPSSGHSLIELLIVLAIIGAVTSFALPQLISQRRLSRSVGITREIMTQLRHTRQLAMSQRQAFTFQYDDVTKQISVIDHNESPGGPMLIDASYPHTAMSKVVTAIPLAEAPLRSEITYGIPSGLPIGALGDGIELTPLFNNTQLNITFQPDGSVIDPSGDPKGHALFIYNSRAAEGTASAISIMGASGRVKIWRYSAGVNRYTD